MTPADRKDTAIGMKTIDLERRAPPDPLREDGEDQAERRDDGSARTTTQMRVFLIAVSVACEANIVLVVVDPDEGVSRSRRRGSGTTEKKIG